jgi:hypothetical protein
MSPNRTNTHHLAMVIFGTAFCQTCDVFSEKLSVNPLFAKSAQSMTLFINIHLSPFNLVRIWSWLIWLDGVLFILLIWPWEARLKSHSQKS